MIRWGGGVTLVADWLMVTQDKKIVMTSQSGQNLISFFSDRFFYINGSGQKERESFFLKLSESLYTEGTHVDVEET